MEVLEKTETEEPAEKFERLSGELLKHLQEIGIPIDEKSLKAINPSTTYESDPSNTPDIRELAEKHGLTNIVAYMKKNGELILGDEFLAKEQEAQLHILYHELGHRIDWLGRNAVDRNRDSNGKIARLLNATNGIPPERVSSYSMRIAEEIDSNKPDPEMIGRENLAELFAQYMESDGTFAGMMAAKISSFDPENRPEWLLNSDDEKIIADASQVEEADEIARGIYFENNPDLAADYEIYQSIAEVLQNEESINTIVSVEDEEEYEDDYDYLEYDELFRQQEEAQQKYKQKAVNQQRKIPSQ